MKFCPQCGTALIPDDRFCEQCGFDTSPDIPAEPEPEHIIPPPATQAAPAVEPAYIPSVRPPDSTTKKKIKKTWLFVVLGVIAFGALGAGGWFVYNKYFSSQTTTPVVADVIKAVPKITAVDTAALNAKVTELPAQVTPEGSGASAKPQSSGDQKIVKQKTNEENKPAKQTTTTAPKTKTDPVLESSPNITANDYLAKILLKVGNADDPKSKNPKNPVKLSIHKPTMIIRIATYHYNDGIGTRSAGTITIKDRNGNIFGSFKAIGQSRITSAPNSIWLAEPRIVLKKGTYYIWDSDMSTWSKNVVGTGFIIVEGYEIK